MTDDIRKAAIEAAARQLHGYIAEQLSVEAARAAIDAYERAMWRPVEEIQNIYPDNDVQDRFPPGFPSVGVMLTNGKRVAAGLITRPRGLRASIEPTTLWGYIQSSRVTGWRPLPLPPEGEA